MTRKLIKKDVIIRGKQITYTFLKTKDAVVIAPYTPTGRVILVRQIRPAVNETILELPAGGIEAGEDPLEAARRELKEETGFNAANLELATTFYASPGVSSEKMHLFLAELGEQAEQELDEGEDISIEEYCLDEAWDLVEQGQIRDAKSIIGLAWLRLRFS